ncbi:adenosine deaminase [Clostridium sp. 19966]|uniref:adenosine deaminase n=1 Tax=Clostridium sp. 19966 TaxID=2768166 RepID=UPI0028E07989|nr:adenosine deaminase [Clostridium sp. 19966]MDT8717148.1 adenosine deaminase [Clostridium sp. 19966]
MDIREIIDRIPKVELHCHLDGSVRPDTIMELSRRDNIEIPLMSASEFKDNFQVIGGCKSLKEYLNKFQYPIMVMQKKENLRRIVLELLEDSAKDGIRYIEIRFAPLFHTSQGLKPEEIVETVLEAMKEGESKYNIFSGLILCCMRHQEVRESLKVVDLAKKYMKDGVIAIDLAGNESDFPPELHKEAFDAAYEKGMNITVHAGETGIYQNILKSINLLHAARIGHGLSAIKDKGTLEYLINNKITLEMCPTSNLNTNAIASLEEHPIRKLLNQGVKITLNTDNRTVSNVSLVDEYMNLIIKQGFTFEEIKQVIRNGIDAAFINDDKKKHLLKEFSNW